MTDVDGKKYLNDLEPVQFAPLPEDPLVSILICSFNLEKYIGRTIESALNQTYKNIEVIICDDGSSDNSWDVVQRYAKADARVKIFRKENGGQASTLNRTFQESSGSVVSVLDADDLFAPFKVRMVIDKFRENPETGFIIHPIMLVDTKGAAIQPAPLIDNFEEGWIAERVIRRGGRFRSMPASTISFRRELGKFIFPIHGRMFTPDGYICTLLPLFTPIGVVRKIAADYTMHDTNTSSLIRDFSTREKGLNTTVKYLKQLEEIINAINDRTEQLGLKHLRIDINDNLDYRIRQFSLELLQDKDRRSLFDGFRRLVPLLNRDTLFSPLQRLIFFSVYLVMIPMPIGMRTWCVGRLHPPNKLKFKILKFFGRTGNFRKGYGKAA